MRGISVCKLGGPEVLKVNANLPKPVPAKGEILVRNLFAGVNYIDTYFRSGLYPMPLPFTPGREAAGIVEQLSQDDQDSGFKVGDRVAYFHAGTYAEFACPSISKCIKLPNSVPFEIGASCLLVGMTALMLTREIVNVKAGDTVLIHAVAGGVGQVLCQLCHSLGAIVIGTTSNEEKAKTAKSLGANHVIDYSTQNVLDQIKQFTNGKGVDVVYDGVGKSTFDTSLACLKPHGWMISYGNASGKPEPFDILRLSKGSMKLARPNLADFVTTRQDFSKLAGGVMEALTSEKLKLNIFKIYSLEEAAQAHQDLESRKTSGKLVIKLAE